MRKLILAVMMVIGLGAVTLLAKQGELRLKDGRVLEGDISETPDGYNIVFAGGAGSVSFKKDQVESVNYYTSLREAYQQKKAKLAKDDLAGLYDLALWAQKNSMWEEMADAARTILDKNPEHAGAKLLMVIYAREKDKPVTPVTPTTPKVTPVGPATQPGEMPLLSDKDINVIRLVEMRPGERMRVTFKADTVEQFWKSVEGTKPQFRGEAAKRDFFAKHPYQQLETIMAETSPDRYVDLAGAVTVEGDPQAMLIWKRQISPWVLKTCGNAKCHGAPGAKPFRLANPAPNDPAVYTNFYILSEFRASGEGRLLNRDKPEDSLLLQFSLAPTLTGRSHPAVPGHTIRPTLGGKEDPTYRLLMGWLTERERGGLRTMLNQLPYRITYPLEPVRGVQPPGPPPGP